MEDASPFVEFSQREDLTVRLRNILHDYAFGPGVFRELLQNADDAGARRFALYADATVHPKESGLLDARLAQWQGPAVVAVNDAQFTDSDFEGIRQVGASVKRSDHSKIGRYGLGFSSTYHLTDVVSFVSRDRLCIFDPHRAHLPSDLPGLQVQLTTELRKKYWAQLAPFADVAQVAHASDAVDSVEAVEPGTMFRLPLRTPELASRSLISNQARNFGDVLAVLKELAASADELLLFLQSVEMIEIHVRHAGKAWCCLGRSWIRTASAAATERMRKERRMLHNMAKDLKKAARRQGLLLEVVTASVDSVERSKPWLVAMRSEPVESKEVTAGLAEDELPTHRVAAVAVPLSSEKLDSESGLEGQAYCFLPLSLATGLPVHISANFALTANRRDLWRRSDDRVASESHCRALWNENLLDSTCPRVYADALELLAAGALSRHEEKKGLPFPHMSTISDALCQEIQELPKFKKGLWSLWPEKASGHFVSLPRRVSEELVIREAAVFLDDQQSFQTAKCSLLCQEPEFSRLKDQMRTALRRLCLMGKRRTIVQVPAALGEILTEVKGTTWLQPQSLANMLKGYDTKHSTMEEADALVEYLLSPNGSGPLALLHELRLCPLLSGRKGTFLHRVEGEEYFWSEDPQMQELLPDRDFVEPSSRTFALLKPRLANSHLNICLLNSKALPALLPTILPPSWRHKSQVVVTKAGQVEVDGRTQEAVRQEYLTQFKAQPSARVKATHKAAPKQSVSKKKPATKLTKLPNGKRNGTKAQHVLEEDEWDEEGSEDFDEEDWEEAGEVATPVAKSTAQTAQTCPILDAAGLDALVRRCSLIWKLVESNQEKGSSIAALQVFPCVPVEAAGPSGPHPHHVGINGHLRLISMSAAGNKNLAAIEDFSVEEVKLLASLGVPLLRPGTKLRSALGLDRVSVVRALCRALEEELGSSSAVTAVAVTGNESRHSRLHHGLKAARLTTERALPLQRLVCSVLRRANKKEAERALTLPIFPTTGGRFAVPLVPSSASVISPDEGWDQLLHPFFDDFLVSWEGAAGDVLRELEVRRPSLASFLANFCAPRAGVFDQELSIRFLESVATVGAVFSRSGASRECEKLAQACEAAPVVVFDSEPGKVPKRCRAQDLLDPDDADLGHLLGTSATFPPKQYCTPLILTVLRKAGLKSFADEELFLRAAARTEALAQNAGGHRVEAASTLLAQLVKRFHGLKWSSRTYASLSRFRIFPAFPASSRSGAWPPHDPPSSPDCVALDTPCTLFEHAPLAWTQLVLLDQQAFRSWPKALLQRFGNLQDPPALEVIVANLAEVARRWSQEGVPTAGSESSHELRERRQQVVTQHLKALQPTLHKRSHATQMMVQHQLSNVNFLVLDDGALVSPCSVFTALHEGADASDDEGQDCPARKRRTQGTWGLPGYMRPFRRLLLGVAGPAVHLKRQLPTINVPPAPAASVVPSFIRNALNKPELADVTFVLKVDSGTKEIYAHRLVLAAACDHFRAMFTSNCAEAQESRCRLHLESWVSSRGLLWLLAYLYQGFDARLAQEVAYQLDRGLEVSEVSEVSEVPKALLRQRARCWDVDTGEDLCCLLRLCEFYDVNHLKKWTENELGKLLTGENLMALSTHAYFCNANQLLNVCIYHLRSQYAELVGVKEWESLEPAIKELVLTDVT